jgi:hypothetical protein
VDSPAAVPAAFRVARLPAVDSPAAVPAAFRVARLPAVDSPVEGWLEEPRAFRLTEIPELA